MTIFGSLLESPSELPATSTVTNQHKKFEATRAELLELRTEDGTVYLRPSRWQRIRLQWVFRNFHVLPPQVLSRGDQRLIEKLAHSAVVRPPQPVASSDVFGVIEKVKAKAPAPANRVFTPRVAAANPPAPRSPSGALSLRQWGAAGAVAGVYVLAILVSDLSSRSKPMQRPAAPPVVRASHTQKAAIVLAALPPTPAVSPAERLKRRIAVPEVAVAAPMAVNDSAKPEERFVSELPPGHFAHPVVAASDVEGEVQLQALIGEDGAVKEVSVVSGDPALAEAGMRAVRQWRYRPYEVLGSPVEVETRIKMSFFGPDAVSIASVADAPAQR